MKHYSKELLSFIERCKRIALIDSLASKGQGRFSWIAAEGKTPATFIYQAPSASDGTVIVFSDKGALAKGFYHDDQDCGRDKPEGGAPEAKIAWVTEELADSDFIPLEGIVEHIPEEFSALLKHACGVIHDLSNTSYCFWMPAGGDLWHGGKGESFESLPFHDELEGKIKVYIDYSKEYFKCHIPESVVSFIHEKGFLTWSLAKALDSSITEDAAKKLAESFDISFYKEDPEDLEYQTALKQAAEEFHLLSIGAEEVKVKIAEAVRAYEMGDYQTAEQLSGNACYLLDQVDTASDSRDKFYAYLVVVQSQHKLDKLDADYLENLRLIAKHELKYSLESVRMLITVAEIYASIKDQQIAEEVYNDALYTLYASNISCEEMEEDVANIIAFFEESGNLRKADEISKDYQERLREEMSKKTTSSRVSDCSQKADELRSDGKILEAIDVLKKVVLDDNSGQIFERLLDYVKELNKYSLIKKEASEICSAQDKKLYFTHRVLAQYAIAKGMIEDSEQEEDLKAASRSLETVVSSWEEMLDSNKYLAAKYLDALETLSEIYQRLDNKIYAEQFKNEALKFRTKQEIAQLN